jgi:hypothetical protein
MRSPQDRFSSGFNLTFPADGRGWLSEGWYGLDQGLLVLMIQNLATDRFGNYCVAALTSAPD